MNEAHHFGTITIHATKAVGGTIEEPYAIVVLENAMITSFSQNWGKEDISDSVSIAFQKYSHEVFDQVEDGSLESAGEHWYDVSVNETG